MLTLYSPSESLVPSHTISDFQTPNATQTSRRGGPVRALEVEPEPGHPRSKASPELGMNTSVYTILCDLSIHMHERKLLGRVGQAAAARPSCAQHRAHLLPIQGELGQASVEQSHLVALGSSMPAGGALKKVPHEAGWGDCRDACLLALRARRRKEATQFASAINREGASQIVRTIVDRASRTTSRALSRAQREKSALSTLTHCSVLRAVCSLLLSALCSLLSAPSRMGCRHCGLRRCCSARLRTAHSCDEQKTASLISRLDAERLASLPFGLRSAAFAGVSGSIDAIEAGSTTSGTIERDVDVFAVV